MTYHVCIGGLHQLPIETVLSKSFSLSSYSEQSQIIPYYYKSAMNMTGEDITIVTLVTRNRIPNLARLATQYQGTIQGNHCLSNDFFLTTAINRPYLYYDSHIR